MPTYTIDDINWNAIGDGEFYDASGVLYQIYVGSDDPQEYYYTGFTGTFNRTVMGKLTFDVIDPVYTYPVFDIGASYHYGDYVRYNDTAYHCIVSGGGCATVSGEYPDSSSNWEWYLDVEDGRVGITILNDGTIGYNLVYDPAEGGLAFLWDGNYWGNSYYICPALNEQWWFKADYVDSTHTFRGKAWRDGDTEPDWLIAPETSFSDAKTGYVYSGFVGESGGYTMMAHYSDFSIDVASTVIIKTGSGSLTLSGSVSNLKLNVNKTTSGALTTSGSVVPKINTNNITSGALTTSGSVVPIINTNNITAGALTLSGSVAPTTVNTNNTTSGALTTSGSAGVSTKFINKGSGSLTSSGITPFSPKFINLTNLGSGSLSVPFSMGTWNVIGNGTWSVVSEVLYQTAVGTDVVSVAIEKIGSGTLTVSGSANFMSRFTHHVSGGIYLSGTSRHVITINVPHINTNTGEVPSGWYEYDWPLPTSSYPSTVDYTKGVGWLFEFFGNQLGESPYSLVFRYGNQNVVYPGGGPYLPAASQNTISPEQQKYEDYAKKSPRLKLFEENSPAHIKYWQK